MILFFSPGARHNVDLRQSLKFLGLDLRITACYGNHCVRALLFHAPDILTRFAVCKVRNRTGIYNVYIGCFLFPYDFIATGCKLLLHGLRFVLVHLAAERVKCCFFQIINPFGFIYICRAVLRPPAFF